MNGVISIEKYRTATTLARAGCTYEELSIRIDHCAKRYVSKGAVCLLRELASLLYQGREGLSYHFLQQRLGVSSRTIAKYLHELEDAYLLKIRRSCLGKNNAVNKFEIDFNGPLGGVMPLLKVPKKDRSYAGKNTPENADKMPLDKELGVRQKVKSNMYNTYTKGLLVPKGTSAARRGYETVEEAVASSQARVVRKRAEKTAKAASSGLLTFAGVKATWATEMLKRYPTVPVVVFTAKDFAMCKQKLTAVLATASLSEFFGWVITSWSRLRETKFKWLRAKGSDVAPAPSLPELMRYWKVFVQAFADSRMLEATSQSNTVVSQEEELRTELRKARQHSAREAQERHKLEERLRRAEKLAYGSRKPTTASAGDTTPSLSERKASLEETGGDSEIPVWCSK
jgi:hypothetical protein